jgi:PEP-CTERM motif
LQKLFLVDLTMVDAQHRYVFIQEPTLRKFLVVLTLLSVFVIPLTAYADQSYGPVTIGTGSPIVGDGPLRSIGYNEYLLSIFTPRIGVFGDNAGTFASQTIAFTFDLAPGWDMALGEYFDSIDGGTTQSHYDAGDWSFEFEQEVILCPSNATSACGDPGGVFHATSVGAHGGPAALPPLTLNAVAEPGTGVYEWEGYARNFNFGSNDLAGFNMYLGAPTATPEPSTFLLLGTGAIGLLSLARRYRRM